ncbi:MAG: riboflavin synthase [Methylophilaceae bacterium]|nr:riboflavin synthase [Methylophilaceae bacterium]
MFTGIIQAVGQIEQVTRALPDEEIVQDVKLVIATGNLDMSDIKLGDSIAVNGVCLTATAFSHRHFEAHVSRETLLCTVGLDSPREVNLEKALRFSDRLGGHLVSGHVDGIGQIVRFEPVGDCVLLVAHAPHVLSRYIAVKGSISIDGISLTVNTVSKDTFSVNLIPHTMEMTTLKHLGVGSRVNLEVDLIARYVERMAEWLEAGDAS